MPCPTCKKDSVDRYKPFCSKRCADLDLGRWLEGDYVLPGNTPLEGFDRPNEDDGP